MEVSKIVDVVLVYPYFKPKFDRSTFRLPPLGLGYLASYLKNKGFSVDIVDCTFMTWERAVEKVVTLQPSIVGVYSMFSMAEPARSFAKALRGKCKMLVAGGPLPTVNPEFFLNDFDIVVKGEGEQTFLELIKQFFRKGDFSKIPGLIFRISNEVTHTADRKPIEDLDSIPFPSRELFPNQDYINYWRSLNQSPTTSIITTRGCPFNCDFCSHAIFGLSYRERTPKNVVDEIESTLKLGYEEIFFIDDCYTLNTQRMIEICSEIVKRRLRFKWECLSRVDNITLELTKKMKQAGCTRVFFGIESGSERILKIMRKGFSLEQARKAVKNAKSAGIKTGAFFILGYPGETDESLLDTINFSISLPLDYLSFTMPYPIPGTGLYEKLRDRLTLGDAPITRIGIIDHALIYRSHYSTTKLKFAIVKGTVEFQIKKRLGKYSWLIGKPFEKITDLILKRMLR
jgi:anaerobic magnesium-protoporphyrin IX monomethyl ester cyclase